MSRKTMELEINGQVVSTRKVKNYDLHERKIGLIKRALKDKDTVDWAIYVRVKKK